jgi:hypothetical protein
VQCVFLCVRKRVCLRVLVCILLLLSVHLHARVRAGPPVCTTICLSEGEMKDPRYPHPHQFLASSLPSLSPSTLSIHHLINVLRDTHCTYRLEATFGASCQDGERMDLQSSTCSLIGVCAQKLEAEEMAALTGTHTPKHTTHFHT